MAHTYMTTEEALITDQVRRPHHPPVPEGFGAVRVLTEIARVYNEAMNIIHYMHDKYYYEKAQMAFIDTDPP